MRTELRGKASNCNSITLENSTISSLSGALKGCLGSLDGGCIEKLLVHCAGALESNDVTLAQQVMWVLNNVASPAGDPNQRLTSWFLRALISRASTVCPTTMNLNKGRIFDHRRLMSVTELARYVDLIPWHRFGFCAANTSIYKAIERYSKVHILDFSISHCMQWPTLIDALAKRPQGPPAIRISVPSSRPPVPPLLDVPTEELGLRLANFAHFKNVPFEFNVIDISSNEPVSKHPPTLHFQALMSKLNPTSLELEQGEPLVINCQHWLRYLSEEKDEKNSSMRDDFLSTIKALNPRILVVADEDSDVTSPSLTSRITASFNYLWILFDALETFLPKDSKERLEYEADIGHRIENIISFEGRQRVERLESCRELSKRMKNAGYSGAPFCEETTAEVEALLTEQASGWGMKKEEDGMMLTWKGHNAVYVTAWVPNEMGDEMGVA